MNKISMILSVVLLGGGTNLFAASFNPSLNSLTDLSLADALSFDPKKAQEEYTALQNSIQSHETQIKNLKTQIQNANQTDGAKQQQISGLSGLLNYVKSNYNYLDNENKSLQNTLNSLTFKDPTLYDSKIKETNSMLAKTQTKLVNLAQIKELQAQLAMVKKNISDISTENKSITSNLNTTVANSSKLTSEANGINVDAAQDKLTSLTSIQNHQNELAALNKANITDSGTSAADLEKQITNMKSQLDTAQTKLTSLIKNRDLQDQLTLIQQDIGKITKENDTITTNYRATIAKTQGLTDQANGINTQAAQDKLTALTSIQNHQNELNALGKVNITDSGVSTADLEKQISSAQNEYNNMKTKLLNLIELDNRQKQMATLQKNIDDINKENESITTNYRATIAQTQGLTNQANGINTQAAQDKLTNLTKLKNLQDELASLSKLPSSAPTTSSADIEKQINNTKNQLNAAKSRLDALQQNVDRQKDYNDTKATLYQAQVQQNNINRELDKVKKAPPATPNQLNGTDLNNAHDKLLSLTQQKDQQAQNNAVDATKKQDLQDHLNGVNQSINELNIQNTTNSKNISTNNGKKAGLDATYTNQKNEISKDYNGIQADVASIHQDIKDIRNQEVKVHQTGGNYDAVQASLNSSLWDKPDKHANDISAKLNHLTSQDVANNRQQTGNLEGQNTAYLGWIHENNERLKTLKAKATQITAQINALQKKGTPSSVTDKDIADAKANVAAIQAQLINANKQNVEYQIKKADYEKWAAANNERIKNLTSQRDALQLQIIDLAVKGGIATVPNHSKPFASAADVNNANAEVTKLQTQLTTLNQQLGSAQAAGKTAAELKPIQDERVKIQNQILALSKAVGKTTSNLVTTDKDITDASNALKNLTTQLADVNKKIGENQTNKTNYENWASKNNAKLTELKAKQTEMQNQIDSLKKATDITVRTQENIDNAKTKLKDLEGKLATLNKQLGTAGVSNLKPLQDEKTKIENEMKALQAKAGIASGTNVTNTDITNASNALKALETQLADVNKKIGENQTNKTNYENWANKNNATLAELKAKETEIQKKMSDFAKAAGKPTNNTIATDKEIADATTEIKNLQDKYAALSKQAGAAGTSNKPLQDEKTKIENEIKALQAKIGTTNGANVTDTDITNASKDMKNLIAQLADVSKKIGANQADKTNYEKWVASNKATLTELQAKETEIQNKINALASSAGISTKSAVPNTDTDIENAKSELVRLEQELTKYTKEGLTAKNSKEHMARNEQLISQINTKIKDLETKIADIQKGTTVDVAKAKAELDEKRETYINELKKQAQLAVATKALAEKQAQINRTVETQTKTLDSLSSSIAQNNQMLSFASSLNTQTRLAKLSNPNAQDTRFAQWIDTIKGKAIAQNNVLPLPGLPGAQTSSSVSPAIMSYDKLRLNAVNNLWINMGSLAGTTNGVNNIAGTLSIGYDAFIKNVILGLYGSYAYTSNSIANISSKNTSHSGDFGVYSRIFAGQSEIDINLGEVVAYNKLTFSDEILKTTLDGNNLGFQTHLDLAYGYVFDISRNWFVKPFLGVGYNYGNNKGMQAQSTNPTLVNDISMSISPYQTHFVSGNIGVEFRKYFDNNQSYFFIAPSFYQGVLLKNDQTTQTRIYSSTYTSSFTDFDHNNLDTSFILKAGGEWQASQNTYINLSIGTKLGNISKYATLNIGARWKF